ncbi:peptidoglycan-associated lipoprotein [Methylovorus sp. MM2]|uniref:peptidoglycan-associated lipoprotein Pal n=1 Tax=Methylovorus sp. MM2 TaxID=1848038 RepID=UPI0007E1FC05|nr:peptidoglycan-associated lipoprotein Pal [Methylovorus sp. MM2]OAM52254.1 peptidoglycan-associated lipoprotein [Methylovorus sp. MM2]
MKRNILVSALLAMMLVACSSKPVKDTTPAPVADKSVGTTTDTGSTTGLENDYGLTSELTDPSNILSKRSVYFAYDKDEVTAEYRPLVEAHAKYLLAHSKAKVILQGNTDERGTREYNLSLGQRRAVAVKSVLNVLGVQDSQIETVSFGEEKPQATGTDEASFSKNRRTDIVYVGE